jgi:hypothetical protein
LPKPNGCVVSPALTPKADIAASASDCDLLGLQPDGLLWIADQPDYQAVTAPNLDIVRVIQPFGFDDSFAIVAANHLRRSHEMSVWPDNTNPIFWHPSLALNGI